MERFFSYYLFWMVAPVIFALIVQHPEIIALTIFAVVARPWLPDPFLWLRNFSKINRLASEIEINPYNQPARIELAETYLKLRSYKKSQSYLQPLLQLPNPQVDVLFLSGIIESHLKNYTFSIRQFSAVLQREERFRYGDTYFQIAQTSAKMNDLGTAKKNYQKFLQINSSNVQAWYQLAKTCKSLSQNNESLAAKKEGISTFRGLPGFLKRKFFFSYWALLLL